MEQIQTQKKTNVLLQYGLIGALASLLFYVMLYIGGTDAFGSPFAFLSWAVQIAVAVLACVKAKKENDGFLEFSQALKISFGVLVISTLATSIFSYVLFNFIDPSFGERMVQLTMEKTQQIMEKFGATQDSIEKAMKEITFENLYSLKKVFQGFMFNCIIQFLVALIISAIVKKKKPEFAA
jgi:hypothetical protein